MRDGKTIPLQPMLLGLWLLADQLLAPKLQNEIIRTFESQRIGGKGLGTSWYKTVYDTTIEGSPLRKYLVDIWDGRKIEDSRVKLPREFLVETLNSGHTTGRLVRECGRIDIFTNVVMAPNLSIYFVEEVSLSKRRRQGPQGMNGGSSNSRDMQTETEKLLETRVVEQESMEERSEGNELKRQRRDFMGRLSLDA